MIILHLSLGPSSPKKETLTLKIKAIQSFKIPATLKSTFDRRFEFSTQSLFDRQLLYFRRKCHPVCMCTSIASKSVQLSLSNNKNFNHNSCQFLGMWNCVLDFTSAFVFGTIPLKSIIINLITVKKQTNQLYIYSYA